MPFSLFFDLKDALSATLHLSRDALHVHIGLIVFLAGAAILRGDRRFEIAFLGLLALCLAGEVADVSRAWGEVRGPNWLGSAKDIVSTMFWPAAWLLAWPQALRMLRAGDVAARLRAVGSESPRSVP